MKNVTNLRKEREKNHSSGQKSWVKSLKKKQQILCFFFNGKLYHNGLDGLTASALALQDSVSLWLSLLWILHFCHIIIMMYIQSHHRYAPFGIVPDLYPISYMPYAMIIKPPHMDM
jgi:hypothetical protein